VPFLESDAVAHICRNDLVVKGGNQRFIDQHVNPARLVLEVFDFAHQLVIEGEKWRAGIEFAPHQCVADKDFARLGRIDQRVVDAALAVDDQPIQSGAFGSRDLRAAFFPARLAPGFFQQMGTDALQPFRLYLCNATCVQARGIDQFGGHDPAPRLLDQAGTGPDVKLDTARAEKIRFVFSLEADIAEQAGQQRGMQILVGSGRFVQAPALFAHDGQQLRMHVTPFAQPQLRQEVGATIVLQLAIGFFVLDRVFEPFPDFQITLEFRFLVGEFLVGGIGGRLRLHRPIARVLHRQGGRDDQHLGQADIFQRSQDHAPDARIERQLGQFVAQRRQRIVVIDRTQFLQQLVTVGNRASRRRLDERKGFDIGQMQ